MRVMLTGFFVVDIIAYNLDRIPQPGEIVRTDYFYVSTGGHPLNIGIDLVKLGLSGSSVFVCGSVGNDVFSRFIIDALKGYNIQFCAKVVDHVYTSTTLILVERGKDRRFINYVGANAYLDFEHVTKCYGEVKPKYFFLAMGALGEFDSIAYKAVEKVDSDSVLTFLDFVLIQREKIPYIMKAIEHSDIVHCNQLELRILTGEEGIDEGAREILRRSSVKLLLVTLGEDGAILYTRSGLKISQKPFNVNVVDPTGAGDAFVAGVLYLLSRNGVEKDMLVNIDVNTLIDMLAFGQATGAACVTMPGATTGVSRETVEVLLKSQYSSVKQYTKVEEFVL
jgi:fructokinase